MSASGRFVAVAAAAAVLLLGACNDGGGTEIAETGNAPTTTTSTTEATTTTQPGSTTTTVPASLEQPAIWPAADVVFDTPEAAAEDFVSNALGVTPTLGDFQAGDNRSGEIEVFSPGEGGGSRISRSTLLLRQLGPDDGWFVLAAVSPNASITEPASGAEVPAGPLDVQGAGRGFEGTVIVTARKQGSTGQPFGQTFTIAGAQEAPQPYAVSLDLSAAASGDVVMLLVRGDTGIEVDPGDFGAIPVVVQ